VLIMIFRSQGLLPARQRLLAYGRTALNKVVTREVTQPKDTDNPPAGPDTRAAGQRGAEA